MTEVCTARTRYGTFSYWPKDEIGRAIGRGEFWEPWLKGAFDGAPAGSTVVDVGANLGWFTVYAAKRGCRVYAFEPWAEVYDLLVRNVTDNRVGHLVTPIALSLYSSRVCLRAQDVNAGLVDTTECVNSGGFCLHPTKGTLYPQYSATLDSFGLTDVSLIKVDTEGCDLEVLKGAVETIRQSRPVLCYEYLNPNSHGYSLEEMNDFVRSLGYRAAEVHQQGDYYWDFVAERNGVPRAAAAQATGHSSALARRGR